MPPPANTPPANAALPVLEDIRRTFGMVPNLFRAYARHPALLEANWKKVQAVLLNGRIARRTKEIMAYLISLDNGCHYCMAAHSAALHGFGIDESGIDALMLGFYPPDLRAPDIALIAFARKVNQHWRDVSDGDLDALRQLGIDEASIIETIGIVELFAGFNRFARSMKVAVDF